MRNNIGRSIAALATILTVAGSGYLLANPDPTYKPKSVVILGPRVVSVGTPVEYTARVTFTSGLISDYPTNTGVVFSATGGTINPTSGQFNPTTAGRGTVTAVFNQAGFTVNAGRAISIKAAR